MERIKKIQQYKNVVDKFLRKLQLFCTNKTRNKGYCMWDKVANRVDDVRTWVKYRK